MSSNGFGGGALGISNIGKDYTPQKYKKAKQEKPTGWFEALKEETGSFLAGENTSSWALFAEIVIGAVPIAGQLIDARDIIKSVMSLKDKPSDITLWFLLIAALIGLIPVFGDAVKSAIKAIKIGGKNPADLFAFIRKFGKGNAEQALKKALDVSKLKGLLNSILTPKFLNSLSKSNKQKLIQIQKDFDRFAQQIINEINGWSKMTPATASVNHAGVGKAGGTKPSTALASTNRNASGETVNHNSSITSRPARKGVMKQHKPKCFKPSKDLKSRFSKDSKANAKFEKDYYKQLKGQQDGINNLTVDEYLTGRDAFKTHGRPKSNGAQANARTEYEDKINESLKNSYEKQGKSPIEAERLANKRTPEIMKDLNALHDPDMIAGGKDKINRLGRADVNKSIGGQWSNKVEANSRVAQMDKAAKEAQKSQGGQTKMKVELNRCK
ncbi:polymorphic toxin type 15 domain-containing protein [Psychrobacter sp.]|uniref:polymorphic toxin type 15 domain-containing protein n=1 Tax=Psychrobacter TaxID=497 RepID=UPI003C715281